MSTEDRTSASPVKKHTFACVRCSDRKVKCDRQDPCNACVRHNAECVFKAPKPPRRRKNFTKEETTEQLKRYETLLRANGIDPTLTDHPSIDPELEKPRQASLDRSPKVPVTSLENVSAWQMPTPASVASSAEVRSAFKPQLLQGSGGTRLADNSLWNRVAQEMREGDGSLEEESESEAGDDDDHETPDQDLLSVFNHASPATAPSHPPPDTIRRLWRIFVTNVNPIFKFIHVPTCEKALEKAIANIDRIPRGFEALMCAIYSVAVLSLPAEDCKEEFGISRGTLLHRYVAQTQSALLRAKFMSTTDLVVLQALLLYLISIRESGEPRAVWSLTGLVTRIAEGMGMRVDGSTVGLPPFETEMRRRVWWQLSVHDFRAAEMCGQAKFRAIDADKGNPNPPTNCDDSALYPGMKSPPEPAIGGTDMMWVMFRTELSGFARGQIARMKRAGVGADVSPEEFLIMDDLDHKDRLVRQVEDLMETKYLRYCDPTQPLHLFTMLGTRGAIKLMTFMCHHPRRWAHLDHVPEQEIKLVWDLTLGILEYYHAMHTNNSVRCFKWNVSYFTQWHAVIHVLDTLRTTPMKQDAEKAWKLIDSIYENNLQLMLSTHRPVFMAVGNLCLKAAEAREAAFARAGREKPKWPVYVEKLREQREAAKARREAAAAKARANGKVRPLSDEQSRNTQPQLGASPAGDQYQSDKTQARMNHYEIPQRPSPKSAATNASNAVQSIASSVGTYAPQNSANNSHQHHNNATPALTADAPSSETIPSNESFTSYLNQTLPSTTNDFSNMMMPMMPNHNGHSNMDPSLTHTQMTNLNYGSSDDVTMMDDYFDADAMLAQGFSLDTPNGGVVDWGAWDNFFGTTTGPTLGVGVQSGVGWDGSGAAQFVGAGAGGGVGGDGVDRRSLR